MTHFRTCPTCGVYDYFGTGFGAHKCKPAWECRGDWQDDDEWQTIHAIDAEEAAEKYAEKYDCESGEYAIVSGNGRDETIILTRKPDNSGLTPERWVIEAETIPHYRATKIESEAAE